MKSRVLPTVFSLLLSLLSMHGQTPSDQGLPDYERIVTQHGRLRADGITQLDSAAAKALEALKAQYTQRGNLEGALKVKAKIDELNQEIESLAALASPPLGTHGGLYTDKHEGQTGWAQFVKENIYRFDVAEVSTRAVVSITAVPPVASSNGEFILKFGDETKIIGTWNQKAFQSGHMQINASKWITKPGKYSIELHYISGEHGLHMTAVSIDTRIQ